MRQRRVDQHRRRRSLTDLADVCAAERLWLHVDAADGGFAALTAKGQTALAGIDRADSVTLHPHKWLYQPMECGCVLIRDGARLERTFAIHPDYLDDDAAAGMPTGSSTSPWPAATTSSSWTVHPHPRPR